MARLWEVIVRPRVEKLILGMSDQEKGKMTGAIRELKEHGARLEMYSRGKQAHALKNSRHANLKELIVKSGKSVWRFAYYIDKNQIVYILSGGDKRGVSRKVFYKRLIDEAYREIDAIERGQ